MKAIYKVFQCSKCNAIIELKLEGEKYTGECKTCKRKIEVKK